MLDISIIHAKKFLTNDTKKESFLTSPVVVEHKTDGIKITIIKKDNTGISENDYIVSYKNNIIYSDEHTFLTKAETKKSSINNAQFSFIWEHLFKLRKNSIPVGTELFIEFLMNKPTLSSNYKQKHGMVLIGHSKSSYKERQGKLITKPSGFDTSKRDAYAKEMKLDAPALLFKGVLGNRKDFSQGIVDDDLRKVYRSSNINWDDTDAIIKGISQCFLDVESKYGGKEEGVVIKYNDIIIKFQQEYQTDQEARNKIKDQYRGDLKYEDQYWKNVQTASYEILKKTDEVEMQKALKDVAKELKGYKPSFTHIKKNNEQVIEDIQMTARLILSKRLNSGALILGKFKTFSLAHFDMIKNATVKYDTVTVAIISSKDTKGTKELRNTVISSCFPDVEIINNSSGNLFTLMNKSHNEITTVIAGSDRVKEYREMLKKNLGMSVHEIPRTDEDISSSKIIDNIHDYEYFKKNVSKCVLPFYEEYLKVYGN